MGKKKFNVLLRDFNKRCVVPYDVLPYFRSEWADRPYNWDDDFKRVDVKTWEDLKSWVKSRSQYQYWARCEYEFLVAPWPFGNHRLTDNLKEFFKDKPDISDYTNNNKLMNIITDDMEKIDVHKQLMYNLDILTDILYEEFFNNKKEKKKKK